MDKTLIASGKSYIDIDALACAVAYSEYLNKTGKHTFLNLSKNLNESITPTVKQWIKDINLSSQDNGNQVIVVDVSEPTHIDPTINQDQITEVYDHHFGYENYWKEKIGSNSHIEDIGACATLIYEKITNKITELAEVSVNLLLTAILSNTLNLKAQITKDRDIKALNELKQLSKLPATWPQTYYKELEENIFNNPKQAIINDVKTQNIKGTNYVISQIELWDSKPFLMKNLETIKDILKSYSTTEFFYTSPSINEGKNYLYCENENLKSRLSKLIGANFTGNIGETKILWLRKEIIREMQN